MGSNNGMISLEEFVDELDVWLTAIDYKMLLHMPEGTQDIEISDNAHLGPVVHFYALIAALPAVFNEFKDMLDPEMTEDFIDTVLQMVKDEVLENKKKEEDFQ